jgi:ATP-dependent DNA ligase
MNIFEKLVLPKDHRKEGKTTQLVKHFDEVTAKHKLNKEFGVQVKKDGVCTLTIVNDNHVSIWSRTGKQFTNTEELVQKIRKINIRDGVYMGEMTCDSISLEALSGIVNPNRVNDLKPEQAKIPSLLQMNWFDRVSIESFRSGKCLVGFKHRFEFLQNDFFSCVDDYGKVHPDLFLLPYQTVTTEEEIDEILTMFVDKGEEGIVIRDLDADWEAGHKGWRVMKKVRGVDYDLMCIGYEEGSGKYEGKVANLLFAWKGGKTIKCMLGKGWSHDMAEEMFYYAQRFNRYGTLKNIIEQPVGKVFQVYALEESSKGLLRLPKVGERRFDKDKSDV